MKTAAPKHQWKTAPISATCEVMMLKTKNGMMCGKPTTYAYPASGFGWMALCHDHAQRHISDGAQPITELFLQGETIIKRDA